MKWNEMKWNEKDRERPPNVGSPDRLQEGSQSGADSPADIHGKHWLIVAKIIILQEPLWIGQHFLKKSVTKNYVDSPFL